MSDTQYILKQIHEIKHLIGALETRVGRLEKWQKPFNKDPRNPKNTVPHDGITATHTKADEWIKCSERLPSEADHYLVALSDPEDVGWVTDKAWTAFYNKCGEWDCCEAVEDGQPVTHWMPLPCPPK